MESYSPFILCFEWSEMTQLLINALIFHPHKKKAIQSWENSHKARDLALQRMTQPIQEHLNRNGILKEPIYSHLEDRLTHEIESLKREIEERKVIIERFKGRKGEDGLSP